MINTEKAHRLIDSIAEWAALRDEWKRMLDSGFMTEVARKNMESAQEHCFQEKIQLMNLLGDDGL